MNELQPYEYNYDIVKPDDQNPHISSPSAEYDLPFAQTKSSIMDTEVYRNFLRNAESRFRKSKEYKTYKSHLMSMGIDHCQVMGNIEASDTVDIELHHNVLNLFDICILISNHVINTYGQITTFDLIRLLIKEHFENRVGVTFLAVTPHQVFTNDPDGYIPPNMTFGKWWELLDKYKFGITFDIANKVKRYIYKYRNELPTSINVNMQNEILNFAYYNEYGVKVQDLSGYISVNDNTVENNHKGDDDNEFEFV